MSADHPRPGTDDRMSVAAGHELSDAQAAPLLKFLVVLFATTLVIAALMVFVYNYLEYREAVEKAPRYPLAAGRARALPPPPRLQNEPFQDAKALRQEEERFLRGYGWVDESAGTVRIPIDRAIEVLAAQGLPHRPPQPAGGAERQDAATPVPAGQGAPAATEAPAGPDGGERTPPGTAAGPR